MAVDQRTTELTALGSIPASAANLLLYAVDLSEAAPADQSKKMALTLLDSRFATAAQGSLAATALQNAAAFATAAQGALSDTALQNAAAFATAAQGVKADSALQAAAIGVSVQAYDAGLAAITAFGYSLIDDVDATAGRATLVAAGTGAANTFTLSQIFSATGATTLAGTAHALQTGASGGANIAIDTASIQARSNGAVAQLEINPLGGIVNIERIRSWSTAAVTLAGTTHGFQIGANSATNLAMDRNVIQARSNGVATTLNLNPLGGTVKTNQASTTAAIPSLWLRQADLSEEFIRFESTVGAGNAINTTALGAYYGRVRVYVEGVGAKWLALYD